MSERRAFVYGSPETIQLIVAQDASGAWEVARTGGNWALTGKSLTWAKSYASAYVEGYQDGLRVGQVEAKS